MRPMRVNKRQMEHEECLELLKRGEFGILSTVDCNNQPYGTPLSYVYYDSNIYFHCAVEGTKLDNISCNDKVCFTVVGKTKLLPSEFTTNYESVMVFGNACVVEEEEKAKVLGLIVKKYSANFEKEGEEYIERAKHKTKVIKINAQYISGKHRV